MLKLINISLVLSLALSFLSGCTFLPKSDTNQPDISQENNIQSETTTEQTNEIAEKKEVQEIEIGDHAAVADITFQINAFEETETIVSKYSSPMNARENTKFLIVDITCTNEGKADITFFPDNIFRIIDNKEREYSTYENSIGNIDNYLNVRKLAPGIQERGFLVYELPMNAEKYIFLAADIYNGIGIVVPLKGFET
jgi:hypothetical protein